MHLIDMKGPKTPALPCLCATIRRASRALTQLYEEALRPVGLRATQFTILQFLTEAGEVTQGVMGQMLAMDTTTLTRTLEIMVQRGWITKRHGEDRREWRIALTKSGESQFKGALPYWEKLQTRLRGELGKERWDKLMELSSEVTNVVTE